MPAVLLHIGLVAQVTDGTAD